MKILFIDDEVNFVKPLVRQISKKGHEVSFVSSFEEAISLIGESSYDLIVSDFSTPKMTLLDFAKTDSFKENPTDVIIISGYLQSDIQSSLTEIDEISKSCDIKIKYLKKPFPFKSLLKEIEVFNQN